MSRRSILRIIRKRVVLLVSVAILTAGCAAPKFSIPRFATKKNNASQKFAPAEDISSLLDDEYWRPASLRVMWSARLPRSPKMTIVSKHHLVVVDQTNMVYALERKKGNISWRYAIGLPVDGLSSGAGDVVVLSRDLLFRIEEENGRLVWSKTLSFVPSTEIVRSRFRICAAGWGSTVYAVRAEDCHIVWRAHMSDNVIGRPIDAGTRVYAVTESGHLSALRGRSGYEEWGLDIGGRVVAGLATDGPVVYVASRDRFLCGASKLGEGILWKFRTKGPIVTTPVAVKGSVYFSAEGDGFYAVDSDGKLKWKVDGRADIVLVGEQDVILVRQGDDKNAKDGASEIMIVETDSGKHRAAVKMPGFTIFPINIEGPEIFCLSKSGYIIALTRL